MLVEKKGFGFLTDLEYENLTHFCSHGKNSGHSIELYKFAHFSDTKSVQGKKVNSKKVYESKKIFVRKKSSLNDVNLGIKAHIPLPVKGKHPLEIP